MRRSQAFPRQSNATKNSLVVVRSCLAPQLRPRITGTHMSLHHRSPFAAELAAGDPLRPHLPNAHREDRLGLANPSLPSDALEDPPFVAGDRRSPAPFGQREGRARENGQT